VRKKNTMRMAIPVSGEAAVETRFIAIGTHR
jgi:hypothetical protein